MKRPKSAAVLIIGDEVLSGRTQEANLRLIARHLAPHGIAIAEARIVPDDVEAIASSVNELRARYAYVVSTGGIGPTHDDKTADAMAKAFGVGICVRDDARAILEEHYQSLGSLNEARLRMARIPDGASLIANPVSKAPGFQIGNVFVLAGIPSIVSAMLQDVGPRLEGGAVVKSITVLGKGVREGDIATGLSKLEAESHDVSFGSYPWYSPQGFGVYLVARTSDPEALAKAEQDLLTLIRSCGVEPEVVADVS